MQERIIHISQQDEPYRRLAEAVVEQAAQDYQDAMEYLYETPHGRKRDICIVDKLDLEEFFRGDWYQMLTGIDGELLIRWLRNNARESVKDRIRQQKGKRVE